MLRVDVTEHIMRVIPSRGSIRNLKLPVMIAYKYWMEGDHHVREVGKTEGEWRVHWEVKSEMQNLL